MRAPREHWIRSALTDERGQFDIAYVSLAGVSILVLGAIVFICTMAAIDWAVCRPVVKESAVVQACRFAPTEIGSAINSVCVAYAAALGALGIYMAATRKQPPPPPPPQTVTTATATVETATSP